MGYAIALDIGTTNIQALLIENTSKRQIDYLSTKNSQALYGEDVITRLGLSLRDKDIQKRINKSIIEDLTLLIGLILKRKGVSIDSLEKVVACGNSAMHHILLGLPLEGLARAPFKPVHKERIFETTLEELGIKIDAGENETPFIFLPNLGGFVGSDALCIIVETGMHESERPILAIDLGTNGEIILGSNKKIFVTSTSAGPAFEGWRIKCGVYGSTLIDIIGNLLKDKRIDKTGFMKRGPYFYEVEKRSVMVTQKDVREFQLAKAAISCSVNILKKYYGDQKIAKVLITGLFGAKINKSNAKLVGILPEGIDLNKVEIKQDTALLGARSLLLFRNIEKKLNPIIKKIKHIELHKEPLFQDAFTSAIRF